MFVLTDSSQACLFGSNVLMHLGVKVQRANGDPVKLWEVRSINLRSGWYREFQFPAGKLSLGRL